MSIEEMFAKAQELQKQQKFNEAIVIFEKIIETTDNKDYAAKASFMIGFIYSENLEDYDNARKIFEDFLEKYPDNESLIESARWELEHMGKDLDTLPIFQDSITK